MGARHRSEAFLEERLDAVKRVEAGESPETVAAGMGINRRTIYRWLEAYHYGRRVVGTLQNEAVLTTALVNSAVCCCDSNASVRFTTRSRRSPIR